jgi:hypothetical protein
MLRGDKSSLAVVKEGKFRVLPSDMKYKFCSFPTLGLTELLFPSFSR